MCTERGSVVKRLVVVAAIAVGVVLPLLLWPVGVWIGLQRQPVEIASLWWFVGLRG